MTANQVDVRGLARKGGAQTSAAILPIRPNGERPALYVVGANALLVEDDLPWDLLATARVLHLGGSYLLPGLDGQPTAMDDLAGPVVFLASDASRFCTGIDLIVDGGYVCW